MKHLVAGIALFVGLDVARYVPQPGPQAAEIEPLVSITAAIPVTKKVDINIGRYRGVMSGEGALTIGLRYKILPR